MRLPGNAVQFFSQTLSIAMLEVLPIRKIYDKYFHFTKTETEEYQDLDKIDYLALAQLENDAQEEKQEDSKSKDQIQAPDQPYADPRQNDDEEEENAPLLFVDVNLGTNEQKRIVVYEGDQAADLARNFCIEHDLDEATQEKLEQLLDQQIASVLTKIEEGETESENSAD